MNVLTCGPKFKNKIFSKSIYIILYIYIFELHFGISYIWTWFYEYFSISGDSLSGYNFKEVLNNFEFNF